MRDYIFSFIFAWCFILPISGTGQIQTYHNGFVAATNNGVYYLMDGDNQWVSFGQMLKPSGYKRNYDTITSVSFNNVLGVHTFSQNNSSTNETSDYYNLHGNRLSEISLHGNTNQPTQVMIKKNSTNKFKDDYWVHVINIGAAKTIGVKSIINSKDFSISEANLQYFTSLATDNDSILVWAGSNNMLYKLIINTSTGIPIQESISGLTSHTASGHQICYDSNNDLFWIVSDEGKIYSYNKSTVTEIETPISPMYSDTVYDISFDNTNNALCVGYRSANFYHWWQRENWNVSDWTVIGGGAYGTEAGEVHVCNDNKGNVFYITPTGCFKHGTAEYGNAGQVADLPLGTVVYDLDYIDYLPYIAPYWDYEGTLTVGFYDNTGQYLYGYDSEGEPYNFGSISPMNSDIVSLSWNSDQPPSEPYTILVGSLAIDRQISEVYIDGTIYNLSESGTLIGISNPFPAVGESCTIKLKYTLIP